MDSLVKRDSQPDPSPSFRQLPTRDEIHTFGRREANKRATRRSLGEAAIALFIENGYAGVSIDDIAERANVSRRTFFHYFASKESAAFPDHDEKVELVRRRLEQSSAPESLAVAAEVALELLRMVLDSSDFHRRRYQLLLEIPELQQQDMRDDLDYENLLFVYLTRSMVEPSATVLFHCRLIATTIVGTNRAALTTWASHSEFEPHDAVERSLRELVDVGASLKLGELAAHPNPFGSDVENPDTVPAKNGVPDDREDSTGGIDDPRADGSRELRSLERSDRRGDNSQVLMLGVGAELVVAAAQVLDEGVTSDHYRCCPVGLESPHRSEPRFQSAVITLHAIVGMLLGVVERVGG